LISLILSLLLRILNRLDFLYATHNFCSRIIAEALEDNFVDSEFRDDPPPYDTAGCGFSTSNLLQTF
jgi:hypothetical protein